MSTIRAVALARTGNRRRSAMRRQAKRRRECGVWGAPVHHRPEPPEMVDRFVAGEIARHLARKG